MWGRPDWGGIDGHNKGCHYFVKVNGAGEWETACMLNTVDPTVTGVATAQADGTLLFQFKKEDSSYSLHLSGLAIGAPVSLISRSSYDASVSDVSCDATTPDFHDGDSDLDPESVYEFPLRNGVTAKMKGWTHKRSYARGFTQNMHTGAWGDKPAEATVTGLQPHTTYTYAVYMYGKPDWGGVDGHHKGCHYFVKVNGGEWETSWSLEGSGYACNSPETSGQLSGQSGLSLRECQSQCNGDNLSYRSSDKWCRCNYGRTNGKWTEAGWECYTKSGTACMLNTADPTVTGVATAQADGTILFQFKK
jgi:hypothetical protein